MGLGLLSIFKGKFTSQPKIMRIDNIINQNDDDLSYYMKNFVRDNLDYIKQMNIFQIANSFKVTNRLLKTLETLYEHSAPCHVIISTNEFDKTEWKIFPDDYDCTLDPTVQQTSYTS